MPYFTFNLIMILNKRSILYLGVDDIAENEKLGSGANMSQNSRGKYDVIRWKYELKVLINNILES